MSDWVNAWSSCLSGHWYDHWASLVGLLSDRATTLLGYYPLGKCMMELLSVGLLSSQTTACPGCFLREVPIRLFYPFGLLFGCLFSHIHRRTTVGKKEASSAFFENWKKCIDFRKKGPDCVHLWVKLVKQEYLGKKLQNVFLRGFIL